MIYPVDSVSNPTFEQLGPDVNVHDLDIDVSELICFVILALSCCCFLLLSVVFSFRFDKI